MSEAALPEGPLIAFYGDDFTGSTASMEVLAFAGLPTILFLGEPTAERLAAAGPVRAIGIAGHARAHPPDWMKAELPARFAALRRTGAPLVHYKVCSTFDSAPHVGSIGAALDIGAAGLSASHVPVVVGAPAIGRYQVFGNLYAAVDGIVHRLDRHPVMSRHPVTPMAEADLTCHLAAQTSRRIGLVDLAALACDGGEGALAGLRGQDIPAIFIDAADEASLARAGALVWRHRAEAPFVVGSQGVQYALVAHWRETGALPAEAPLPRFRPVERIAVVSGSCSPVTADQIAHAGAHGFKPIRLAAERVVDDAAWQAEILGAVEKACAVLSDSRASPLVFSAAGPDDPALSRFGEAVQRAGIRPEQANTRLGEGLGAILRGIVDRTGLARAVIAGGDTSGAAMSRMGVYALQALAPLAPGSPLCRASSDDPRLDGIEVSLKGGQMGGVDIFVRARDGSAVSG
jgi:uncharacterized protein YgbK (DUF1537 family)